MGNTKTDFTVVHVDTTGPAVSPKNSTDTKLTVNYGGADAKYNYTSRYVAWTSKVMACLTDRRKTRWRQISIKIL